ncbi:MAG: ABC transporter ATP-binding protein [Bacillota bacterium]
MSDLAVQTTQLKKSFGEINALRGVNLTVPKGTIFALLGPNGAGKTTTVRLLTGVIKPSGGQAEVAGYDVVTNTAAVRQRVGVMTETAANYERLTAQQNLEIFGQLYGQSRHEASQKAKRLLETLGLSQRAKSRVETFSTGMKKRVLLARALIHDPEVLFLDEPTSGLDPEASEQVLEIIRALCAERKHTVLLCTHNLDEAQRLCDQIAVVKQGEILAAGSIPELEHRLWTGIQVVVELENRTPAAEQVITRASTEPVVWDANTAKINLTGRQAIPGLVRSLVQAEARIMAVHPQARTLREIYFKLMGGEEHALADR